MRIVIERDSAVQLPFNFLNVTSILSYSFLILLGEVFFVCEMETTSQDNRKCALDALERRFAIAKAEFLRQQRKKEVGPNKESGREVTVSLECQFDVRDVESSGVSTRKGVVLMLSHCHVDHYIYHICFLWLFKAFMEVKISLEGKTLFLEIFHVMNCLTNNNRS